MKMLWYSRRTFVALVAIGCCTWIGLVHGSDTTMAIASIAAALVGSNAYEGKSKVP